MCRKVQGARLRATRASIILPCAFGYAVKMAENNSEVSIQHKVLAFGSAEKHELYRGEVMPFYSDSCLLTPAFNASTLTNSKQVIKVFEVPIHL